MVKNKKGSVGSTVGLHRVTSNTSSSLSPKTVSARQNAGSGSFGSNSGSSKLSPEKGVSSLKAAENLVAVMTSRGVQLPGLPFKSFRNGTLVTHNGEPSVRPAMDPLPPASISRLSASSPAFHPSYGPVTPSPKAIAKNVYPRPGGIPTPPTPGYEKIQNLLQGIRSSPTHGGYAGGQHDSHYGGYNGGSNGGAQGYGFGGYIQQNQGQNECAGTIARYSTPPGPIGGLSRNNTPSPHPSSVHSYDSVPRGPRNPGTLAVQPPRQVQTIAQRPTREFLARKDRGKKDILVTADGITRNHVRIIERQLPNGIPYQDVHNDFDAPKYNFVEEFKALSAEDKESFLAKNFIDVLVQMKTPEEEFELTGAESVGQIEGSKGKKRKNKLKSKSKDIKDLEVKDPKETDAGEIVTSTAVVKHEVTSLDVLKSLGPEINKYIKRLTVTLAFPPSNNLIDAAPMAGAGPVPQVSFTPASGPTTTSSDFVFLKKLVDYIHNFTKLTHLSIILRVPATQRMPFTMPQLHHVLPFYDLDFTDWDIKYLPENLSVPAKIQGWAVGQLDRERNKIIAERLRKVEEAVFVRGSVMPGINNDNLKTAQTDFNSAGAVASTSAANGARAARNSRSSRASR